MNEMESSEWWERWGPVPRGEGSRGTRLGWKELVDGGRNDPKEVTTPSHGRRFAGWQEHRESIPPINLSFFTSLMAVTVRIWYAVERLDRVPRWALLTVASLGLRSTFPRPWLMVARRKGSATDDKGLMVGDSLSSISFDSLAWTRLRVNHPPLAPFIHSRRS